MRETNFYRWQTLPGDAPCGRSVRREHGTHTGQAAPGVLPARAGDRPMQRRSDAATRGGPARVWWNCGWSRGVGSVLCGLGIAFLSSPAVGQFAVDREFASVFGSAGPVEHYSLDVFTSPPAIVNRLVSVGAVTPPAGPRSLHVAFWSTNHTVSSEIVAEDTTGGDLIGYGVDVAANGHVLIAGEYREATNIQGVFACRLDPMTSSVLWTVGLSGDYQSAVGPWSYTQPAVMIKELANGDVVVGRTRTFDFPTPAVGVISCLDGATGFLKWSMVYADVTTNRSIGIQDFGIAPPGSVVPPAGSIVVVGSIGTQGLVMNVNSANGAILWPIGANSYNHVTQWRGIDMDPATSEFYLSGVRIGAADLCSGPTLVVARLTPGTCGSPPPTDWITLASGLDFVPAPSAVALRVPPAGFPERVLVAGGTTCYDRAFAMLLDAATGVPITTWSDQGGSGTTYARTRDLAGTRYDFRAHTIGTRGLQSNAPTGVYVSAANCTTPITLVPDALPIECQVEDVVVALADDLQRELTWRYTMGVMVEVYDCGRPSTGGASWQTNTIRPPLHWPP